MVELREFIEARLADDERIALAVQQRGPWVVVGSYGDEGVKEDGFGWVATGAYNAGMDGDDAAHIARHEPARVLREVEAKRRTLARHPPEEIWIGQEGYPPDHLWHRRMIRMDCSTCRSGTCWDDYDASCSAPDWPCAEVRDVAAPYSDHPEYDPAWAPEATT